MPNTLTVHRTTKTEENPILKYFEVACSLGVKEVLCLFLNCDPNSEVSSLLENWGVKTGQRSNSC